VFPSVLDQLTVFQEATKNIPADVLEPMAAHITGGHAQLFRYDDPTEKPTIALGPYVVSSSMTYAWPNQPVGSLVDVAYTAVYIDNAYLQYYQDLTGAGDTIAMVANFPSRIRAAATNWAANGASYPRAPALYDRDVQIGDAVMIQASGSTLWTTVTAVIADQSTGVVGSAVAAASNAATQSASTTPSSSGPTNWVVLSNVNAVNYDGSATGGLHDVYTIAVTQASTGGDATTARMSVATSSGGDNVTSLQPAPFSTATLVGGRGLRLTWTNTTTSNSVSGGISAYDFAIGQTWQVSVNQAWTAPVATSGGSYSGLASQQYIVKVSRGGLYQGNLPLAAPLAAPTVNPVGGGVTGGSLQPASYRARYTWVIAGSGETVPGAESGPFTVQAGNVPQVTFLPLPSVPVGTGAVSANLYITPPGGAPGTEVLYQSGITSLTYNMSAAMPNVPPNTSNMAGSLAAPTVAPTVLASGGALTGGALMPGVYLARYTFVNANGESPPSPESGSFNVASGNIPSVTFLPLPAGATGVNLYITPPNGASLQEFITYATGINPATPYLMNLNAPTLPPITNTSSPSISATPVTPTVTAAGGGAINGKLPAGSYYVRLTSVNAGGETLPGVESAQFTIVAGNIPRITNVPSTPPANATSFNVYLTPVGGALGSEVLYSTGNVFSTGFYDMSAAPQTTSPLASAIGSNTTNPNVATPGTAATVVATGGGSSGGLLPPGPYYLKYTYVNYGGETPASGPSAQFSVAGGNVPRATFPALPPGALARKIYLTPTNAATGTEILYAVGVTGLTYDLSAPMPYGHGPLPVYGSATFTPVSPTTAPTINPTGGGSTTGNLAPGTYFLKYTCQGSITGESTPSSEVSFSVGAGNIPTVSIPGSALPSGVQGYRIYLTQPGGASNSETLLLSNQTLQVIPIAVSATSALTGLPPTVTTAMVTGTNTSPPQITVSTSVGTDFSGPTSVTAAGQAVTVGTLGVTISFTGNGLALGDVYNIPATAVGVGPIRTLVLANNLPTALQGAADLSVTLSIKHTTNWQLTPQQVSNPPNLNWSATTIGLTVNANATAYDPSWTKGGVPQPLLVTSGPDTVLYGQYRAWMPTYATALNAISDPTTLQDVFGYTAEGTTAPVTYPGGPRYANSTIAIPHPDTVLPYALYKALTNSNGQPVYFTALSDPTQLVNWQNVLASLVGLKNIYALVPLSRRADVQAAYMTHVTSQADTAVGGEWRATWLVLTAPTAQDIVFAPVAPATTPPATTTDGQVAQCTIANDPTVSGTHYTYLVCTSTNGQFVQNGVQPGDQVRMNFSQDAFGNPTYTSYTVGHVVNQDTLVLASGLAYAQTLPQRFEIWRIPTPMQVAQGCAAEITTAANPRVRFVWPDTINDGGITVHGAHLCAALAAYTSAIAPMQSIRNLGITGFDAPVPRSTQYFNQAHINVLADAGAVVVTSDTKGNVFTTVAKTAAQGEDLNSSLEGAARNLDALNYLFYARLQQFFGKANITPVATQMMAGEVNSGISYAKSVGISRLGSLLRDASIQALGQSALALDRVALVVNVSINYPVDDASVTLLV
jgi:hypothetical protein